MLAPPPEGFDGEHDNLPLKNLPLDSSAPEQVPLLTQNHTKDVSSIQVHLPVQTAQPRARVVDSRKSKVTKMQLWFF